MKGEAFIPRSDSKLIYVFAMACYSWTIASLLQAIVRGVSGRQPPHELLVGQSDTATSMVRIATDLIYAPILETIGLITIIEVLRRFKATFEVQVFVSAIVLSALHSAVWAPWGLIVLPSFLIYAYSYLRWHDPSPKVAFGMTASIHALRNLIPAIGVVTHMVQT